MEANPHGPLTREIIGAAIEVHRRLGPGLFESAYLRCLHHELVDRRLRVACEVDVPVSYKGVQVGPVYRVDMVVEDAVIVELKSVELVRPVHEAQLLTYLRLSGKLVGLLINFNVSKLIDGITRRALSSTT